MTFDEFMAGYGNYFGSRGDEWLNDYIKSLMDRGMITYEIISNEIQELSMYMSLTNPENFVGIGYAWSKRDRLIYMLTDWNTYQKTGEKYF